MRKRIYPSVAIALMLAAGASAQEGGRFTAFPEVADVPQPHLERALQLAAQQNSWRHPALVACYPYEGQPAQNVNMNPDGTKIFDNLYFVGNGKYGTYAIDTSDGIILIDSMNSAQEVQDVIIPNMKEVGLDPNRLKVLIISHGHADHFGGSKYLIDNYGVEVYQSEIDYQYAKERWAETLAEGNTRNQGPPPESGNIATDGGTITLGDTAIRTFVTPGHTPGTLTMLIPVTDRGTPHTLAYLGGTTSKGISLQEREWYENTFIRLEGLFAQERPDGLLSPHPNYDDAVYKIQYMRTNPERPNPFLVGTEHVIQDLQIYRECNLNNGDTDKAHPYVRGSSHTPAQ